MAVLFYKWLLAATPLFFPARQTIVTGTTPAHPFYVSVTEINHNAGEKTLEISCKLFTEDFEHALAKASNARVDIYHPSDSVLLEKYITDYIRKHLQIKLDGQPVSLQYMGHEIQEQSTWNYFQVKNVNTAPKKVEVVNDLLFELFDSEMSIIHVSVNGNRKSTKLDYPATTASFEF